MKSKQFYPAMLATLLAMGNFPITDKHSHNSEEDIDIRTILIRRDQKYRNLQIAKKGLKVFNIEGIEILARNENNAMRKFNNMKNKQC